MPVQSIIKKINKQKAFSLVEILLAISIFSIFSIGIVYLSLDTIKQDANISFSDRALFYAQEGIEAGRNIRDQNFILLTNGDHGLLYSENKWNFVAAPETIDNFYFRTVTVEDVYRDASGNINTDGEIYDPDTKKINSQIDWLENGIIPRSVELTSYVSNWRGNEWIKTTCTEFNNGIFDNTEIIGTDAPPDDNCGFTLSVEEEQSTFYSSADIGKHGNDVDVDGSYAYLAVDDVNKGLSIINVSDPANLSITKNLNVNQKGEYVRKTGDYVYMGINSGNKGLAIIDASSPSSASLISTGDLDAYGNQPGIDGNYLFMSVNSDPEGLQIFDISAKNDPQKIDTINFGDEVHVIEINGTNAYIGLDDDHNGLRVMDISLPNNIEEIASLDVGEEVNAINISGFIAYVGTEESDDSLKIVDISNPADPEIIANLNVNGEIQDLAISGNYLYAAVDESHSGLAAINISDPFDPYLVYNLDVGGKGTGIDADSSYVYVSTDTANKGLVLIGTTENTMSLSGTYLSDILDTGSQDPVYNFISWTSEAIPGATVKFQIRTADTEANLASATWVGPDGTAATYYENSRTQIVLDGNRSGQRYVQFIAYIESDGVSAPIIESVLINYSP